MKTTQYFPNDITEIFELYRPKVSGIGLLSVAHAGIGLKKGNGEVIVLHRTPDHNTHISSYESFAAGQDVTINQCKNIDLDLVTQRAEAIHGQGDTYSVFKNCEHLSNFVLHGTAESEQLKAALIGLGISSLIAVSLKNQSNWVKAAVLVSGTAAAVALAKKKKIGTS
jgi:hypothetical protein